MTELTDSQPIAISAPPTISVWAAAALRIYLGTLVFLLPFKFGGFVTNGEQAHFPLDVWQLLFFTCLPCYLVPPLCGLALLLAVLVHRRLPRFDFQVLVPLVWSLPLLAGIVGIIVSTEQDYARQWYGHFAGVAAFAWAAWWSCMADAKMRRTLLHCLAVATLLLAVYGWRQHFGGLAAMQDNMAAFSQEQGFAMQEIMLQKMAQKRVYGTFVDPNVFAAHLLLCFPLTLVALALWAKKFSPPRLSSGLFLAIGIVLFAGVLFWSGSRGALIGLTAGGGLAVWHWPRLRRQRWHWLLPVAAVAVMLVGLALLSQRYSRDGLKSASARLEYYRVAGKLWRQHPLTGVGLGEFFPWYMRLKPVGAEETRDPHNFFLSFASQCGLLGALAALAIICLPLWLTLRPVPYRPEFFFRLAACAGAGAWGIHALFQFNELIPATVCLVPLVCLLSVDGSRQEPLTKPWWRPEPMLAGCLIGILLVFAGLTCLPWCRIPGESLLQVVYDRRDLRPEVAFAMLREAGRKLPRSPAPPRIMVEVAQTMKQWEVAMEGAEEMVRRTPHRASAYLRKARLYIRKGEWEQAQNDLQMAELWYPGEGDVQVLKALLKAAGKEQSWAKKSYWCDLEMMTKSRMYEQSGQLVLLLEGIGAEELWKVLQNEIMIFGDGRKIELRWENTLPNNGRSQNLGT